MKKRVRVCDGRCHHAKLDAKFCRCICGGALHGSEGAAARVWVAQMGEPALVELGFKKGEARYVDQLELPV